MRSSLVFFLAVVVGLSMARAARADVDNRAVETAIKKAKAYLIAKQGKDGNWEDEPSSKYTNNNQHDGGQWGGVSALVTYALLAAGESPQEPHMQKAVAFLKTADLRGTYALACRMQVWLLLPTSREIQMLAKRDAEMLLAATKGQGTSAAMHDYTNSPGNDYSHSRTQYAVLAMWAAEQMGLEVPQKYWEMAENQWVAHQDPSGGWTYKALADTKIPLTPGMTAAGVATLFITQDYVHANKAVDCRGNMTNPAIDKGVAWLTKNFDKIATDKPFERSFPYATLYAVERVGVAGGLKFFGTHDWYDKGANWLLKKQKTDGSFPSAEHASLFTPLVETSFATLFMVRGRAPVAFNKLDYTSDPKKPALWNQRPRDVANLTRWIGQSMERDLNWQVVNLNVAPEELLDGPILYIAGSQVISISDEHAAKLRTFVEMGGMIVGHADCAGVAFANSFRKLGQQLFAQYEFRELPAEHPIYNGNYKYSTWKQKPAVQGLSNGARELMVLIHAGDPARLWQTRAAKGREEPWQLAANMYYYVTDRKDMKYKGDTWLVSRNEKTKPSRNLSIARLEYSGNWNPEPGGWRRLANWMHNTRDLELKVETVKLGEGDLSKYQVAHLTGTTKFKLDDKATASLKAFLEKGGTLIIDATGGASEFVDSADQMLKGLYPEQNPAMLPADHPVYQRGGKPVDIAWRPAARNMLGNLKTARLQAIEVNNRKAIFFSREDLSVGLVGQPVDGVIGYAPDTATELMGNLVESVVKAPAKVVEAKPATKPATKPTATKPPATKPKKTK